MPARNLPIACALLLSLMITSGIFPSNAESASPSAQNSPLNSGLHWLISNQTSTGSYGDYFEHWTAAAAYALWLNNSNSPTAALSYSWLAAQLNSSTSWFWGQYGEADVPGAALRSVATSQNLALLNISEVSSRLLAFQETSGGFRGYYDPAVRSAVTSSVDTALALWGLIDAGAVDASSKQAAVNYLFSLQNSDGSFNLTKTIGSDEIYSQAPESVSITAMVTLCLRASSVSPGDSHSGSALNFLSAAIPRNFTTTTGTQRRHVYSASITALALNAFGRNVEASQIIPFILSLQNPDGGFRDEARGSGSSNALDTGWAVAALLLVQPKLSRSPGLNPLVLTVLVASVAVPVVAIMGAGAYYRRRRRRVLTPA